MQESKTKTKPKSKLNKYIIYIISFAILLCTGIYCNQNIILEWSGLQGQNNHIQESGEFNDDSKNILTKETEIPVIVKAEESSPGENNTRIQHRKFDNKLSDYHNYLFNINLLVANFFQNKAYTNQINVIDPIIHTLPLSIQRTLSYLNSYNTQFLTDPKLRQNEVIFPQKTLLIKKFVTIEKKSKYSEDMENLRSRIIEDIEDFISFFCSEKFQQKFIE
jgi:hypothetical protein